MKIALPAVETVPVAAIKPYWRNPRRIPPEAVEAVGRSMVDYGDVQPIVVDSERVIIVGHTRHQALVQLGVEETEVYVADDLTPAKVKEYRLADNRLGEMTDWDHGQLVMELREWEEGLLKAYFPEVDLHIGEINSGDRAVTAGDIAKANREVKSIKDPGPVLTTHVRCPACMGTFDVSTASMPGLSRLDFEQLSATARGAAVGDGGAE